MTHEQLTDAVRASANLSSSSAERRGTYPKRNLVPGGLRLPSDSRSEATRVHASGGEEPGQNGCPPAPTRCPHGTLPDVTCPECVLQSWDTAPPTILPGPEQPSMDEEAADEWLGWDWHYPRWG